MLFLDVDARVEAARCNGPLQVMVMERDYSRDYIFKVCFRSDQCDAWCKYILFTVTHAGTSNCKLEGKGEYL